MADCRATGRIGLTKLPGIVRIAHRPKSCKLVENRTLARIVTSKLQLEGRRSKFRVAQARLSRRRDLPRVARTIYRSLFIQARGALKIV